MCTCAVGTASDHGNVQTAVSMLVLLNTLGIVEGLRLVVVRLLSSAGSPLHCLTGSGLLQKKNLFMKLTIQVLDNATETVAVGSDNDVLSRLDFRADDFVPEGQGAGDGVFQGLAGGQLTWLQVLVAP